MPMWFWVLCWASSTTTTVGKYISYSWSAEYRISTNGSGNAATEYEALQNISASGTDIHIAANQSDLPRTGSLVNSSALETDNPLRPSRRPKRSTNEKDESDEDELQISPELKIKLYTGVILATVCLIVFVLIIWPMYKCMRTCCRYSTTCCLSCWDLMNCRDPGYRFMCLAAKESGLDPPSPEEYDRFMTGWEDRAPDLMEALMDG